MSMRYNKQKPPSFFVIPLYHPHTIPRSYGYFIRSAYQTQNIVQVYRRIFIWFFCEKGLSIFSEII